MTTPSRYLDAAATSPLRPEARDALLAVLDAGPGNPSSVHSFGHRARQIVEESRERIAVALGARPAELVITGGGTEANNLGIIGLALANPRGRHIVTTVIEHPSVLESCRYLQRMHGFELTPVSVDEFGRVDPDSLFDALRPDTTLVSVGLANAEVGTVQDLPDLAVAVKQAGALLHTDAVQAAAALPVGIGRDGWPGISVDAMTIAAHKFGGPQGAGALLIRHHLPLEPLIHGGGQEKGARSGTENVAAIAAFAAAVEAAMSTVGTRAEMLATSRDALIGRVLAEVPGTRLTGHPTERLPGHASFTVEGTSGESLLVALDAAGIAASSGSACAAGKNEPSPVLLEMGICAELAQTALRFTLAEPIEPHVVDRVITVLKREVARAQKQ